MDRRRLESRAAIYLQLRGILAIPAGLLFLLAALGNWEAGPFRHDWVFVVCLLAIGAAHLLLVRAYRRRYGRISPSARQRWRTAAALALAVVVVVGGSLLLRSEAGFSLDLPVNPLAVTLAVVMVSGYAIGGALRAHHGMVYGALLVAGALPVWSGEDPGNVGLVLCGAAVIVSGALDHIAFTRAFGRPALDA